MLKLKINSLIIVKQFSKSKRLICLKQIILNSYNILYIYDATGIKQQKVADGTTTQYAGGYIYENSSLKFASHTEGYIEPDGTGGYNYVYQYKDHLGNIRLSYSDADADGIVDVSEIVEESNYYPFGLKHRGYNGGVNGIPNKFLTYNGKEFEESLGLNMHEMDMRHYDAAIGRWIVQDPITHHTMSPYNAFDNNPVFWADPSGGNSVNGGMVGADGLTNNQWVNASRPGGDPSLTLRYLHYNRQKELDDGGEKFELPEGQIDFFAPGADGTNEVFRIYGEDATHIFYSDFFARIGVGSIEAVEEFLEIGSWTINTSLGIASTKVAIDGKYYKWNEIWHKTKTRGIAKRWQSRWNRGFAAKIRDSQIKTVSGSRALGTKLGIASILFIGADVAVSGEIRPSHLINATMVGGSFTGVGSVAAGIWFIADFGTMGVNYLLGNGAKGLGDMIDESEWGKRNTIKIHDGIH